jgi:peptidoglycan/LPS O-acetylase OafA/YrhL
VVAVTLAHSLLRWAIGRSAADPGLLLYETHFAPLDWLAKTYVVGTNAVLWGQDAALFLEFSGDGRSLDFTTNFAATYPFVEKLLLVPQAWSLSIELGFYLLAPWLVMLRTASLVGILIATLVARIALAAGGLSFDPWTYRFFPVEIGSFTAGMIVYRSMAERRAPRSVQWLALAGLIAATLTLSAVPDGWPTRVLFYAYCAWALPYAFQLTRKSRVDRYLGDLSYPVYLSHLLVISVSLYSGWSGSMLATLIVVLVALASIALHETIQKPVDAYRAARVARMHA